MRARKEEATILICSSRKLSYSSRVRLECCRLLIVRMELQLTCRHIIVMIAKAHSESAVHHHGEQGMHPRYVYLCLFIKQYSSTSCPHPSPELIRSPISSPPSHIMTHFNKSLPYNHHLSQAPAHHANLINSRHNRLRRLRPRHSRKRRRQKAAKTRTRRLCTDTSIRRTSGSQRWG